MVSHYSGSEHFHLQHLPWANERWQKSYGTEMPFLSESDLLQHISLLIIPWPEIGGEDQSIFLWCHHLGITVPFNITRVFHQEAARSSRLGTNPHFLTVKSCLDISGVSAHRIRPGSVLNWKTHQLLVSFCEICQVTSVRETHPASSRTSDL